MSTIIITATVLGFIFYSRMKIKNVYVTLFFRAFLGSPMWIEYHIVNYVKPPYKDTIECFSATKDTL